jgi:hypothetical protein
MGRDPKKKTQQQNTYKSTQSKDNPHKFWLLLHSSFSHTQQNFNLKTQLSSASAKSFPFSAKKTKFEFFSFLDSGIESY